MTETAPDPLAMEADAIVATLEPPPPLGTPEPAPAPADAESWPLIAEGAVSVADVLVCPGWNLTDAEKAALRDALAPVLADLFPDGLGNSRWAPYMRLAMVGTAVVASRIDPATGKLPPLRKRLAPATRTAAGPAPTADPMPADVRASF